MIPDRRFRPEHMTAAEAIAWLQSHRYIWYHAPMDISPRRLFCTSKLKLWKRSPERFAVSVELPQEYGCRRPEVMTLDNEHLDRLRLPFPLWHHGITATVSHVKYVGQPRCIVLHQSNGYHLTMSSLDHAIHFAKRQAMQLKARWGRRERILVPAHPPISGERNF